MAKAKVIHMIDADSLLVMDGGRIERVQLIGVDAPEMAGPKGEIWQCYNKEAKKEAASLFTVNREVTLESDGGLGDKDVHGRLLRYVKMADGNYLNDELLRKGLAREYHPSGKTYDKSDEFAKLQIQAKAENLGIWDVCHGAF
ncbi:thermonuclease family protein [Patescibacteria group bacterium]|nr:thermonuclease family protein [Patescibacteria group bacterium]